MKVIREVQRATFLPLLIFNLELKGTQIKIAIPTSGMIIWFVKVILLLWFGVAWI
jgi:hypothetical protein